MATDINDILLQAEKQQKRLELEVQFRKNMAFFEKANIKIFRQFENYKPKKLSLIFSDKGYVNLVNIDLGNKPVYSSEPRTFSQEYVDKYAEHPSFFKVTPSKAKALDIENDAHISKMNKLVDTFIDKPSRVQGKELEETIPFMLMYGVGLGYQIDQLLEKCDIRNLCIIEPHVDIFYAALHTVDWQAIYSYFDQPNHSINIILGQTTDSTYNSLRIYLNKIGVFNAINPYIFDHLCSEEMKAATQNFFEKLPSMIIAAGYFDDEQVSLSHTIANYRQKTPPLRNHPLITQKFNEKPAFVIANGPSLDKAKDFLLEHQEQAIIFSCGTALGSLAKMGIKPDFHIEMERTRPVVEWIDTSTSQDFRNDIIMLGLNTVHPDAFALFPTTGMGMKTNDMGSHYLSQYVNKGEFVTNLTLCNPTVGNAGMAFSTSLGFKEIYLFGMDFGFSETGQHHSSYSKHYEVKDEHVESLNLYKHDAKGNVKLPGNFGGQIVATNVYANARIAVETILKMNKEVRCYNTSEGALIRGAEPTRYEAIKLPAHRFNKHDFCKQLYKENFHLKGLSPIKSQKEIRQEFLAAETIIPKLREAFLSPATSWEQALDKLNLHHQTILKVGVNKKTEYIYTLLKGSVSSFNMAFKKSLYCGESKAESLKLFNQGRHFYLEFLDHAMEKIEADLLKKDSRSRDLSKKVK